MSPPTLSLPSPVAVVGGAGFLGAEVCRLLQGRTIRHTVVDRAAPRDAAAGAPHRLVDIRDLEALTRALAGHQTIVHLAAEWNDVGVPDVEYETTNVTGSSNVATAADRNGIARTLFVSSSSVYDFSEHDGRPYAEDDAAAVPPTLYGRTKVLGEKIFREWQERGAGRVLRIVRPSVIYGPHNRGNVYHLVRQALGWSFVFVGPRSVVKSIAFVENVAGFLLHVLEHDARDTVFNYCDEPALSTWDMVQLVRRLGAVRGPLVGVPAAPSLLAARVLDRGPRSLRDRFGSMKIEKFMRPTRLSRARALATGYVQRVAVDEALRRTVAWIRSAEGRAGTPAPARP